MLPPPILSLALGTFSFHSRIPILGISSDYRPERCHRHQ
jgi:hypothetical protein